MLVGHPYVQPSSPKKTNEKDPRRVSRNQTGGASRSEAEPPYRINPQALQRVRIMRSRRSVRMVVYGCLARVRAMNV